MSVANHGSSKESLIDAEMSSNSTFTVQFSMPQRLGSSDFSQRRKLPSATEATFDGRIVDILTTVSRLGASIVHVEAGENQVDLIATGREFVIRRLPKLLDRLVMVAEVRDASAALDLEAIPLVGGLLGKRIDVTPLPSLRAK